MTVTSLRARLLLGVLGVVAAGLLAANVATYAALGRFLEQRIDQQLQDSQLPVFSELSRGAAFPGSRSGRPSGKAVILSGTYAELRQPFGTTVRYVSEGEPRPELPAGRVEEERYLTVGSSRDGFSYRVLVTPLRDGSTLLIALPLEANEQTLGRLVAIEVVVSLVVLGALAALSLWVVRVGLRPLDAIGSTAEAIAAGDLSRRVDRAEPETEVGRLGLALNVMLGRIEGAFAERRESEERLRRFVADASHELRTPLTSIRGYAELFRHGAAQRPEDLATAMRRIEEEAARMGVLVDDLLLLARLDQGRPLERAPVDLARLAADAVADTRAAAPDREITLASNNGPVVVLGDEARLRQVAANLLTNARVHTPPGTPVHVRVEAVDGRARLEVADEGPGVPPDQAPHVFERFYRVDKARTRSTGGAGLGLSIVAALAEAHGGRAFLEPGFHRGVTFVVELPLMPTPTPTSSPAPS